MIIYYWLNSCIPTGNFKKPISILLYENWLFWHFCDLLHYLRGKAVGSKSYAPDMDGQIQEHGFL